MAMLCRGGGGVARQGSARCKSSHLHCEQPLAPLKTFPPPSFVCLPVGLVFSATPGSAGPAALFTHSPLHWRVCEESPLHNVLLYSTFPRILGLFSREEKILLGLGLTVAQRCIALYILLTRWLVLQYIGDHDFGDHKYGGLLVDWRWC